MTKEETKRILDENKIILVVRGIYGEELLKLADALGKGGIRAFEVTYDPADPDTLKTIKENIEAVHERHPEMLMGCGTVLTVEQVLNAKAAGAEFIVSPNFDPEIVKATLENGLVSVPGCMTPTEICAADKAGADYIKLFPAGTLGMKYCKDILAPLHHVRYIATVGVTEETFREYLELGFAGAAISSKLIDKKCRDEGNWDELTRRAKAFTDIAKEFNK